MERHITIAGALYTLLGLLVLVAAGVLFFGVQLVPGNRVASTTGGLAGVMALLFALAGVAVLLAGVGLLRRERWGRTWGLVVTTVALFLLPLVGAILGFTTVWIGFLLPVGAAIAGYAAWVMLHKGTRQHFAG